MIETDNPLETSYTEPIIAPFSIDPEYIYNQVIEIRDRFRINMIDAVIAFCEKQNYDIESIARILPQSILVALEEDAVSLRLLKRNNRSAKKLFDIDLEL